MENLERQNVTFETVSSKITRVLISWAKLIHVQAVILILSLNRNDVKWLIKWMQQKYLKVTPLFQRLTRKKMFWLLKKLSTFNDRRSISLAILITNVKPSSLWGSTTNWNFFFNIFVISRTSHNYISRKNKTFLLG